MAAPNFVLFNKKRSDYKFVSNMEQNLFKLLPSEIINNIFLRLPARTIAVSKCVCRSWLDLVDKDEFVKAYFSRSHTAIAVLATRKVLNWCGVFELKDEIVAESRHDHRYIHPTKSLFPHLAEVLGSANGLLLLKGSKEDFDVLYACNPITREYIKLACPEGFAASRRRATYGIGASKITGQHKVVRIKNYSDCSHVYTLGTGLWRRVEAPRAPFNNGFRNSGAFFNGNLHWLVRGFAWISCFDLETECFSTFSVSPVPPQGIEKVSVLMDCLCLCDNTLLRDDGIIVIWLMKEYGVEKSWTKEFVINLNFDFARITLEDVTPIKVFNDGDIMMQWGHEVLFYYSNKTKTSRKICVFDKGYPQCSMIIPIFPDMYSVLLTPSFVSLKTFEMENVKPMKCSLVKKFWGAMADWRLEFFVIFVVYILGIVLISKIIAGNR